MGRALPLVLCNVRQHAHFHEPTDADEIDVTVATFDQPEIVTPADHIWTEDRISWIKLADNLPRHARGKNK
jgi:hypothetical protein